MYFVLSYPSTRCSGCEVIVLCWFGIQGKVALTVALAWQKAVAGHLIESISVIINHIFFRLVSDRFDFFSNHIRTLIVYLASWSWSLFSLLSLSLWLLFSENPLAVENASIMNHIFYFDTKGANMPQRCNRREKGVRERERERERERKRERVAKSPFLSETYNYSLTSVAQRKRKTEHNESCKFRKLSKSWIAIYASNMALVSLNLCQSAFQIPNLSFFEAEKKGKRVWLVFLYFLLDFSIARAK